jgi:hypothetical protein
MVIRLEALVTTVAEVHFLVVHVVEVLAAFVLAAVAEGDLVAAAAAEVDQAAAAAEEEEVKKPIFYYISLKNHYEKDIFICLFVY